jgi:hypothetical protein
VNRCIREVYEGGQHLGVAAGLVEVAGIPQRENGADELDEVFLPLAVWSGTATCMLSVLLDQVYRRLDVRASVS